MESDPSIPNWLIWARAIQGIAQTGLHFAAEEYDIERYEKLQEIAAEMFAHAAGLQQDEVVAVFKMGEGYATPKVDVRGAVINQAGELLMVREKRDDGWTLPGGWADLGDLPSMAAEREVWEEAGYQVKARKLVGVYDANRSGEMQFSHAYKLVFLCDLIGGEATTSSETSEVCWFSFDKIPQPFSGERIHQRHIDDLFAVYQNPQAETVFD